MSRRNREEIPFGSDSFLDVLANIVGILIILIVAAAARMGRAPLPVLLSQNARDAAAAKIATPPTESEMPSEKPPRAPLEPESDEPPPEITAAMQTLTKRLAALHPKALA